MAQADDERAPLIASDSRDVERQAEGNSAETPKKATKRQRTLRAVLCAWLNPWLWPRALRLIEIADQSWFPGFLRRRCQSMLAAQWMHRLPILQRGSPAKLASGVIGGCLSTFNPAERLTVVDFCSGGGGPIPVIEKEINQARKDKQQRPVLFLLSDLHPSIDDWIDVCAHSDNLSFVPQPVDATDPPPSVVSSSAPGAPDSADSKVFRLFALSFHHFDDNAAARVLRSALDAADGFAIVELQERKLGSALLMLLDFPLLFVVTLPWFWWDIPRLLFTYALPVLPAVMAFDGVVSSLRTRTFDEVVDLLFPRPPKREVVKGNTSSGSSSSAEQDYGAVPPSIAAGDWRVVRRAEDVLDLVNGRGVRYTLRSGRQQHTWPLGYLNYIVGMKS